MDARSELPPHQSVPASSQRRRFLGHAFCLAIAATLLCNGCGNGDMERKLVGTWGMNVKGTAIQMTFASDHTYTITYTGRVTNSDSAHWALKGKQLVVEVGTSLNQTVLITKLDDTNLVVQGRDPTGDYERRFTRVK